MHLAAEILELSRISAISHTAGARETDATTQRLSLQPATSSCPLQTRSLCIQQQRHTLLITECFFLLEINEKAETTCKHMEFAKLFSATNSSAQAIHSFWPTSIFLHVRLP